MQDLLLITFIISMFCVGLRIISSKEMIFYFLRKPYEKLLKTVEDCQKLNEYSFGHIKKNQEKLQAMRQFPDQKKEQIERLEHINNDLHLNIIGTNRIIRKTNVKVYILKPIIGCVTCMASVWTLVWFPLFLSWSDWMIIPVAFVVAFLNTALYELVGFLKTPAEKIEEKQKEKCIDCEQSN